MIKANELRLGNKFYVKNENLFCEILSITQNATVCDVLFDDSSSYLRAAHGWAKISDLKPLPLTPEILEQCGFMKWGKYKNLWKIKNVHSFTLAFRSESFHLNVYPYSRFEQNDIKYLHQLQNLFFAIIGEELQIKDLTNLVHG